MVPTGVWRDCQGRSPVPLRGPGQRGENAVTLTDPPEGPGVSCLPLLQPLKGAARLSCFPGTPTAHSLFPWYFQPVTNALISGAQGAPGAGNRRPCPDGRGCGVPMTVSPGWPQTCHSPSRTQRCCPPRWGRRLHPAMPAGENLRQNSCRTLNLPEIPCPAPWGRGVSTRPPTPELGSACLPILA